jgi:hypothetical protein
MENITEKYVKMSDEELKQSLLSPTVTSEEMEAIVRELKARKEKLEKLKKALAQTLQGLSEFKPYPSVKFILSFDAEEIKIEQYNPQVTQNTQASQTTSPFTGGVVTFIFNDGTVKTFLSGNEALTELSRMIRKRLFDKGKYDHPILDKMVHQNALDFFVRKRNLDDIRELIPELIRIDVNREMRNKKQ